MRFFCSRKGAATARAAMMMCAAALPVMATVGGWMISEAWKDFIKTKDSINRIELYVAGAVVRGQGWEKRLVGLEDGYKVLDHRVDDIDRRLFRAEAPRR